MEHGNGYPATSQQMLHDLLLNGAGGQVFQSGCRHQFGLREFQVLRGG